MLKKTLFKKINYTEQKEIQALFYGIILQLNQLIFMTDVAFMQSFLRRKEISKDQENNEQENFYRLAWGGGGYKEKFVQGKMFCTDRFMSSSRGENQRTFIDEGICFLYIMYVMVQAPTGSQGLVNSVNYLILTWA